MGVKQKQQREAAVMSALALWQQLSVHGEALDWVEVFKYLGRLLAQDDDDIQAIRNQMRKARGTWARVGQVLRAENVPPRIAVKFYKAVVQAVLLYGSETRYTHHLTCNARGYARSDLERRKHESGRLDHWRQNYVQWR